MFHRLFRYVDAVFQYVFNELEELLFFVLICRVNAYDFPEKLDMTFLQRFVGFGY